MGKFLEELLISWKPKLW